MCVYLFAPSRGQPICFSLFNLYDTFMVQVGSQELAGWLAGLGGRILYHPPPPLSLTPLYVTHLFNKTNS